ncbi:tissue inhibitor of metalloproteinase [Ancylostoma ceylanicum]|uniref:Tissue inhibitor of metalloproteinase n=1 Tax=Ancylostoma ceylanicum TaxID=53326 RepID=A0A0D6LUV0_9BILA|nr:tissue inhibitor of metalloproteinase [Ancylostoma ceylanicum]
MPLGRTSSASGSASDGLTSFALGMKVDEDARGRPPSVVDTRQLKEAIEEDPSQTTRELGNRCRGNFCTKSRWKRLKNKCMNLLQMKVLIILCSSVSIVLSCSCFPQSANEVFCQADWVSRVKVTSFLNPNNDETGMYDVIYTVNHIRIYKNPTYLLMLPPLVYTPSNGATCGLYMEVGKQYLLSATWVITGRMAHFITTSWLSRHLSRSRNSSEAFGGTSQNKRNMGSCVVITKKRFNCFHSQLKTFLE